MDSVKLNPSSTPGPPLFRFRSPQLPYLPVLTADLSFMPFRFPRRIPVSLPPSAASPADSLDPSPSSVVDSTPGCALPLFRPYVARLPWHGGPRALLSRLVPRYGHYCGPNWSSGKEAGLGLWDRRPVDWLDFCCYCHDMGYDSHSQSQLLKADIAFLNCLQTPQAAPATAAAPFAATVYQAMCIAGLRVILIPYRKHLIWLSSGGMSLASSFRELVRRVATTKQRAIGGQKHGV